MNVNKRHLSKRLRFNSILRKFQSSRNSKLMNLFSRLFDFGFGYISDIHSGSFSTISYTELLRRARRFRIHRKIVLEGYFPSLEYFAQLNDDDKKLTGLSLFSEEDLMWVDKLGVDAQKIIKGQHFGIAHFRAGDNYSQYKDVGMLPLSYYSEAIEVLKNQNPSLVILGFSDNIPRAKELYADLDIVWVDFSDSIPADVILKIFIRSRNFIASHSGLATFAGLLDPSKERIVIAPEVQDGNPGRAEYHESLTKHWKFIPAKLWINA